MSHLQGKGSNFAPKSSAKCLAPSRNAVTHVGKSNPQINSVKALLIQLGTQDGRQKQGKQEIIRAE